MSKVTSKATHWIRQQGYNEENLPGDEYWQMLQAYEAGYREREKEHIEIHSRQERGATRIAELEKENAELKGMYAHSAREAGTYKQFFEEMKCCGNCKHFDFNEPNYCYKGVYRERQYVCSEWEFGN